MSKANGAPRKAPTHFETVPLEVVKNIAEIIEPPKKPLVTPVPRRAPAAKRR